MLCNIDLYQNIIYYYFQDINKYQYKFIDKMYGLYYIIELNYLDSINCIMLVRIEIRFDRFCFIIDVYCLNNKIQKKYVNVSNILLF